MRTWEKSSKKKLHIEIIPMIDVMMFLLVFFILISLNVIPALGIKTKLPEASHSQALKQNNNAIITLGINHQLQLDGKNIYLDALVTNLKKIKNKSHNLMIIIRSDKQVPIERLVNVMDHLKGNGFINISIATKMRNP